MSSYTARWNKINKKVGSDPGIALKISGGGGTAVSMRKANCNQRCVSHKGGFSINGPPVPNSAGLVNVTNRAVITRKTDYRKYPMGTIVDINKDSTKTKTYSYPDEYNFTSGHHTRMLKSEHVDLFCTKTNSKNSYTTCVGDCKSVVSGTRNNWESGVVTETNRYKPNIVKPENIKLSSEYRDQIARLGNDFGWKGKDC